MLRRHLIRTPRNQKFKGKKYMGYAMDQMGCKFFIRSEDQKNVLQRIQELSAEGEIYRWVARLPYNASIEEAFATWRWELNKDSDQNITHVTFIGEKLGDENVLFSAIAPWVRTGSYIQMLGEDNTMWRWAFYNGNLTKIHPTINW